MVQKLFTLWIIVVFTIHYIHCRPGSDNGDGTNCGGSGSDHHGNGGSDQHGGGGSDHHGGGDNDHHGGGGSDHHGGGGGGKGGGKSGGSCGGKVSTLTQYNNCFLQSFKYSRKGLIFS